MALVIRLPAQRSRFISSTVPALRFSRRVGDRDPLSPLTWRCSAARRCYCASRLRRMRSTRSILGCVNVISEEMNPARVAALRLGLDEDMPAFIALADGRPIITLPSTRMRKRHSNIVWDYPHNTIPRHLRDIVVTEYGAADLRGKTDAEVIRSMLNIADSAFQSQLLQQAKEAGKVPADYEIPQAHCSNTPERIQAALQTAIDEGHLPSFPLGSGLTKVEEQLAVALSRLSPLAGNNRALLPLILVGLKRTPGPDTLACLKRMQLDEPNGLVERLYRALLLGTLETGGA